MPSSENVTTQESELLPGLFLLQYYEYNKRIGYGYVKNPQSKTEIRKCIEDIKYFFRENYIVESHKATKKSKKKKSKRAK